MTYTLPLHFIEVFCRMVVGKVNNCIECRSSIPVQKVVLHCGFASVAHGEADIRVNVEYPRFRQL